MTAIRSAFLAGYDAVYRRAARPLIFRSSAQQAHESALSALAWLDDHAWTHDLLRGLRRLAFADAPREIGGVTLPYPLMLAAGLVKGLGFDTEAEACAQAETANIMPGWRSLPLLAGPVEFGSFTRWPRLGNTGETVWRDVAAASTQNRVGLKNPGAQAAAHFLSARGASLPPVFGVNVAPSPGLDDLDRMAGEVTEAIAAFLDSGVVPSWLTLNLSCPNTEDDPTLRQTEAMARTLIDAATHALESKRVPLWVKVGPTLSDEQYFRLTRVFADSGVRAVVAVNTLARPVASDASLSAGVGGSALHERALAVVRLLATEKQRRGYNFDIVGCGGVMDGQSCRAFLDSGASAVQYWSALVYRGPLAAALVLREACKRQ